MQGGGAGRAAEGGGAGGPAYYKQYLSLWETDNRVCGSVLSESESRAAVMQKSYLVVSWRERKKIHFQMRQLNYKANIPLFAIVPRINVSMKEMTFHQSKRTRILST